MIEVLLKAKTMRYDIPSFAQIQAFFSSLLQNIKDEEKRKHAEKQKAKTNCSCNSIGKNTVDVNYGEVESAFPEQPIFTSVHATRDHLLGTQRSASALPPKANVRHSRYDRRAILSLAQVKSG